MKGLLLKDLYLVRQNGRYLLTIIVMYIVLGMVIANITMTLGITTLMCVVLSLSLFSLDDSAKWDLYARTLPVARKDVVSARYLAGVAMLLLGVLISLMMWGVFTLLGVPSEDAVSVLAAIGGTAGAGLAMMAVLFPLIYRYGVEKARMSLAVVFLLPLALSTVWMRMDLPLPQESTVIHIIQALAVLVPLGFLYSWRVSQGIYAKKEY